jgi:intracellular sulfur oxidation DsrE/DsrF family protein
MKETDMREPPTPEYLNAFLDGELTADERAHVLALLESDPDFKLRTCEMRTLKELVKGAYQQVPAAPALARRSPFSGAPRALAAGLLLALGIGAGWLARDFTAVVPGYDRLSGLPDGYQAIALSERVDSGRIILHLDSGEPGRLGSILDLAEKLLDRQPSARIEIVANSYGLDLLRADVTPLKQRIENMARRHANLSFVACGQTVARLKREGVGVSLLPVARTASSAINEIMTRMGQGWVYVKV